MLQSIFFSTFNLQRYPSPANLLFTKSFLVTDEKSHITVFLIRIYFIYSAMAIIFIVFHDTTIRPSVKKNTTR